MGRGLKRVFSALEIIQGLRASRKENLVKSPKWSIGWNMAATILLGDVRGHLI